HGQPRGLRGTQPGGGRHRPLYGRWLRAAHRHTAFGGRHAALFRGGREQRPGAGIPLTGQGPRARADHRRGRHPHPLGRRRRRPLRRGRAQAGPAARPARLVSGTGTNRPRRCSFGAGLTARYSMAIATAPVPGRKGRTAYPGWLFLPAAIIYGVLFLVPTFASLYFSLTRWTLFDSVFIGL